MGIAKAAISLLMKEGLERPFSGSILTLGKQDVFISKPQLEDLAVSRGYQLHSNEFEISSKPHFAKKEFITDQSLFKSLGFSTVTQMDISDYEGAGILFDLNEMELPNSLTGSFDFIYDGGTLEHVFDTRSALLNIFKMLKVGGRAVHLVPSSNYTDHGFYMFSPTLFLDFYGVNKFDIKSLYFIQHTRNPDDDPWRIYDYKIGCLDHLSFGGLDDQVYAISCTAMKVSESTGHIVPQQRCYQDGPWVGKAQYRRESITQNNTTKPSLITRGRRLLARLLAPEYSHLLSKKKGMKVEPLEII
jgi:SAM-dependent methyltransferase